MSGSFAVQNLKLQDALSNHQLNIQIEPNALTSASTLSLSPMTTNNETSFMTTTQTANTVTVKPATKTDAPPCIYLRNGNYMFRLAVNSNGQLSIERQDTTVNEWISLITWSGKTTITSTTLQNSTSGLQHSLTYATGTIYLQALTISNATPSSTSFQFSNGDPSLIEGHTSGNTMNFKSASQLVLFRLVAADDGKIWVQWAWASDGATWHAAILKVGLQYDDNPNALVYIPSPGVILQISGNDDGEFYFQKYDSITQTYATLDVAIQ